MLSAFGLGEATFQNSDLTEHDIYSSFIINIFIAFIFSLGFFVNIKIYFIDLYLL